MTVAKRFVFGQPPNPGAKSAKASEVSDTPEVGHIRNYSNYLVPAGARDLLTGLAIVVRGLVANVGLTLPIVLVLAIVTIMSNPARSALYAANVFGVSVNNDCDRLHWISERIGFFSLIGLVLGLAIYVVGRLRYGAPSRRYGDTLDEIRRDRWELFAYGAGIAITLGVICDLARFMPVDHFGLTLTASIAGLVMFFFWWAIWRSYLPANRLQEFRGLRTQQDNSTGAVLFGRLPTIAATYLVLLFLIAFFEFQPFMIAEMFDNADAASDAGLGVVAGVAVTWLKSLAAITAPIAAAVTLFRQQFAALLKGKGTSDLLAIVLAHSANLAIWIAGAALPLLIWIAYLYLTFWGITNDKLLPQRVCPNAVIEWPSLDQIDTVRRSKTHLSGKLQFDSDAGTLSAEIKDRTTQRAHTRKIREGRQIEHAPGWVNSAAGTISHALRSFGLGGAIDAFKPRFGESVRWSVIALYLIFAIVLFRCSWCLAPNANSLHRLYRDRLSKAFLFKPLPRNEHAPDTDVRHKPARNVASIDQGRDLEPLDEAQAQLALRPWKAPCSLSPDQHGAQHPGLRLRQPQRPQRRFLRVRAIVRGKRGDRLRADAEIRERRSRSRSGDGTGNLRRGRLVQHGIGFHQGADTDARLAERASRLLAQESALRREQRRGAATAVAVLSLVGNIGPTLREQRRRLSDGRRAHRESRRLRAVAAPLQGHHCRRRRG